MSEISGISRIFMRRNNEAMRLLRKVIKAMRGERERFGAINGLICRLESGDKR